MKRAPLLVLVLLVGNTLLAEAAGPTVPRPISSGNVTDPNLFVGDRLYVTWAEGADNALQIRVASSLDNGRTWSDPVAVTDTLNNSHPQLVQAGTRLVLIWLQKDVDARTIMVATSDDHGVKWTAPKALSNVKATAKDADITASRQNVLVVWTEPSTLPTHRRRLWEQRSSDGGLTWLTVPTQVWQENVLDPTNQIYSIHPRLAASATRMYLTYLDNRTGAHQIYGAFSNDGGQSWSPDVQFSFGGNAPQDIAVALGDSAFFVAWSKTADPGNREIFWKSWGLGLENLTHTTRLTTAPNDSVRPSIAALGARLVIAWVDYRSTAPAVFVNESADGGQTWLGERVIPSSGYVDTPNVALTDAAAHFVLESDGRLLYQRSVAYAPLAPQLSVSVTGTRADLAWGRPEDGGRPITGYTLERVSNVSTNSWNLGATTFRFSDPDLAKDDTFRYRIQAINEVGPGAWSGVVTVRVASPPVLAATQVTGLAASQVPAGITLSWTPNPDAQAITSYRVYRNGALFSEVAAPPAVDNASINGTTYAYAVSAVNAKGEGNRSIIVEITPHTNLAPGLVTSLLAVPAGTGNVSLSWPPRPSGEEVIDYQVLRDGAVVASVHLPAFNDSGLPDGSAHVYRVGARNGVGAGPLSEPQQAVATRREVPTPPRNLSANVTTGHVTLSWVAPRWAGDPAFASYIVERTADGSNYVEVAREPTTIPRYEEDVRLVDGPFLYRVTAASASARSVPSNVVAIGDTAAPPNTVESVNLSLLPDGRIHATWPLRPRAEAVTRYDVLRDGIIVGASTNGTFDDAPPAGTHTYAIVSVNPHGRSAPATATFVPPAAAPKPPDAPEIAASGGARSIRIYLFVTGAARNATAWSIYRGTEPGSEAAYQTVSLRDSSFVDSQVAPDVTYYYAVTLLNDVGESAYSAEASANITGAAPRSVPLDVRVTGAQATLAWAVGATNASVDWGDGTPAAASALPASHEYVASGSYHIVATARTSGGVARAEASVNVTLPPKTTARLKATIHNSSEVDTFVVAWEKLNDPTAVRYEVLADGRIVASVGAGGANSTSVKLDAGSHSIRVRAILPEANVDSDPAEIQSLAPLGGPSKSVPQPWIVMMLGIVAAALVRRRAKS